MHSTIFTANREFSRLSSAGNFVDRVNIEAVDNPSGDLQHKDNRKSPMYDGKNTKSDVLNEMKEESDNVTSIQSMPKMESVNM